MTATLLDASVTNSSDIISISVSDSHTAATATAQVEAVSTSLDVGSSVTVRLGYSGDTPIALTGYVKAIERKVPEDTYNILISNTMIRAVDYFIASSSPDNPFKRSNISAENLVRDIMQLAGLTSFSADATSFTFAVYNPVEVNLTSSYDYGHFIASILAYNLYADNSGTIQFRNRRPYPMGGDSSVYTVDESNILNISYEISDRDLRNRVVVYGTGSIHAEASAVSPYLPSGFYKTVVVAAPGVIDTQSMASQSASYNLALLNKLTKKLSISIIGKTGIQCRDCVTVNVPTLGISSELWYVYSIEHNWSRNGYVTNMELRL